MALAAANNFEQACRCFVEALRYRPRQTASLNNLALAYKHLGRFEESEAALEQAVVIEPTDAELHTNLGEVLKAQGKVSAGLIALRRAVELRPDLVAARSNLLLLLHYEPGHDPAAVYAAHCLFGRDFDQPSAHVAFSSVVDRHRRLRVGYVSPDFRQHPVARFIEPVLRAHDTDLFDIVLYSHVPRPDAVTERLLRFAQGHRNIVGHSSHSVAAQIREDKIDILVDLAEHTALNRLDVFALRPAPVQATWLGYPNTTGLQSIHYRITDEILDPITDPTNSAEQLVRLAGGHACFQPPSHAPIPVAPPCLKNGFVTFGVHHQLFKLNDPLLSLWKPILDRLPASRLRFVRSEWTESTVKQMRQRLRQVGIDPRRCRFIRPQREDFAYLRCFNEIDLILDAMPFSGHTTNCEAMWVGLPVVTLRGDAPAGRLTASVLTAMRMNQWIADTPEDYQRIAVELARDRVGLAEERRRLRRRMAVTVCDANSFTRRLESEYHAMWQRWCECASSTANQAPIRLHDDACTAELTNRGLELIRANRLDAALPFLQRVVDCEPESAQAHFNLGNLLRLLGRAEEAGLAHERAISLNSELRLLVNGPTRVLTADQQANRQLAKSLKAAEEHIADGRWPLALQACQRSLALDPNCWEAHGKAGLALHELGRLEEAKGHLCQALELNPRQAGVLNNLGNVYQQLSRFDAAMDCYRQALLVDENCLPAYCSLGSLLNDQGRLDEARPFFRKAYARRADPVVRFIQATALPAVYDSTEQV